MSEVPKSEKKQAIQLDRVTIDPPNLKRLDSWLEQLANHQKGISLKKKDLVNWLIEEHSECLSPSELKLLAARFYDEEKFLRYACEEIRKARSRGERLTLEEILGKNRTATEMPRPRKQKKKAPEGLLDPDLASISSAEDPASRKPKVMEESS